jgi:hypothetical protein
LVFSVKVLLSITHEKMLVDCREEFEAFVEMMDPSKEKRGVVLFQFPYLDVRNVTGRPHSAMCGVLHWYWYSVCNNGQM